MEIFPEDLGPGRAVDVVETRMQGALAQSPRGRRLAGVSGGPPPPGLWARVLRRDTGMDEPTASRVLERVGRQCSLMAAILSLAWGGSMGLPAAVAGVAGHQPLIALVFGALGLGGVALGLGIPRMTLRRVCRMPLSSAEIDAMHTGAHDDLERTYLLLVRDALGRDGLPDAAAAELRTALRLLGEAIDRLPPAPPGGASLDPAALLQEAQVARTKALDETDRMVADSLLRQAEALERSADAVVRAAQTLRRNATLRDELRVQAEALRLGLATQTTERADSGELGTLAGAAQRVARETISLAAAQAELDQPAQLLGIRP